MGGHLSVDSNPFPIDDIKNNLLETNTIEQLPSHQKIVKNFQSNIKAWVVQKDKTVVDLQELDASPRFGTISGLPEINCTPLSLYSKHQIFKTFEKEKCYLVLHVFRKNFLNLIDFENSDEFDKIKAKLAESLAQKTENHQQTDLEEPKPSLFELCFSSLGHLSPRGLDHQFSTPPPAWVTLDQNKKLINFVEDYLKASMRPKTSSTTFLFSSNHTFEPEPKNDLKKVGKEDDLFFYDLYLWYGKDSDTQVRAHALTKAFELESCLLADDDLSKNLFFSGAPMGITEFYFDDISTLTKAKEDLIRLEEWKRENNFEDDDEKLLENQNDSPSNFKNIIRFSNVFEKNHLFRIIEENENDFIERVNRRQKAIEEEEAISTPKSSEASSSTRRSKGSPNDSKEKDSSNCPSPSPSDSNSSRFSLKLDSVERSADSGDPSPTPRTTPRKTDRKLQDYFKKKPMSGSEKVVYYRKILSKIRPNLFIGSDLIARNKDLLKKTGITHIINAAQVACDSYFPNDFEYLTLSLFDTGEESILGTFFLVIDFIERARKSNSEGKVLVHCFEGVSRSTTVTIAYLMWKSGLNFNTVLEDVKSRRPVCSPNAGFIVQLLNWEKMLKTPSSVLFRIAPQNNLFADHGQVLPKLCVYSKLMDSRTCFVLCSQHLKKIFVWVGKNSSNYPCKIKEMGDKMAAIYKKYITLERYPIVTIDEDEIVNNPESQASKEFNIALENVEIDKNIPPSMLNVGEGEERKDYPDLDLLDDLLRKKNDPNSQRSEKSEEESEEMEEEGEFDSTDSDEDGEAPQAVLYQYASGNETDNETTADSFEEIENFDSDDLLEDGIFVLKPEEENIIYVWIGAESEAADDAEVGREIGEKFSQVQGISSPTIHVITQDQEQESETIKRFFDYFVNG